MQREGQCVLATLRSLSLFCGKCLPSSPPVNSLLLFPVFTSSFLLAHRLLILCTRLHMKGRLDQPQTRGWSPANACCRRCFSLPLCLLAFGEDAILTGLSAQGLLPLASGRDLSLNYSLEQRFSVFLMLQPFSKVPHVVVTAPQP